MSDTCERCGRPKGISFNDIDAYKKCLGGPPCMERAYEREKARAEKAEAALEAENLGAKAEQGRLAEALAAARRECEGRNTSVLQDWVTRIPIRMQSTLILALRGPDGRNSAGVKSICRWLRGLAFKPGNPGNYESFMGPPPGRIPDRSPVYHEMMALDAHAFGHLLHALEVVAARHPQEAMRGVAADLYGDLCATLHLPPEPRADFEARLCARSWPGGRQPNDFAEASEIMGAVLAAPAAGEEGKRCVCGKPAMPGATVCDTCHSDQVIDTLDHDAGNQ